MLQLLELFVDCHLRLTKRIELHKLVLALELKQGQHVLLLLPFLLECCGCHLQSGAHGPEQLSVVLGLALQRLQARLHFGSQTVVARILRQDDLIEMFLEQPLVRVHGGLHLLRVQAGQHLEHIVVRLDAVSRVFIKRSAPALRRSWISLRWDSLICSAACKMPSSRAICLGVTPATATEPRTSS